MTKRCDLCGRKLNNEGKCTNAKCPKCVQHELLDKLQNKQEEKKDA